MWDESIEQEMLTFSTLIVSILLCVCACTLNLCGQQISVSFRWLPSQFIESSSCRCSYNFIFSHSIALFRLHQRTHSQWDQLLSKILMSLSVNYNDMGNKKKYIYTHTRPSPQCQNGILSKCMHGVTHGVMFYRKKCQIYFEFSKKNCSIKFVSLDNNDSIVINSFPTERNKLDNFQFISNCATHTHTYIINSFYGHIEMVDFKLSP